MRAWTAPLAVLTCVACLGITACGDSPAARTPTPAPDVELTTAEKDLWAELPPDRSEIPVLVYHGIGPESNFSNADDAAHGVGTENFAKQMTMMKHAGYETVDLQTFVDFVNKRPVDLPARPVLLTFDDARADSWTGSDGILHELGFNAVMFVDVGRVDQENREYLTWDELQTVQDGGRWQLQLHSGRGHTQIRYGPGPDDYGPYYAYEKPLEGFDGWQKRVESDITWGQETLSEHIPAYRPLAFTPPYGEYGQHGSNDARIEDALLGWLTSRYDAVFTQDASARAKPGSGQPLGRFQVTRATTAGELNENLLSGQESGRSR